MAISLSQNHRGMDPTLYTRYVTLCTTLFAIVNIEAMPTDIPTSLHPSLHPTKEITTEHSLENNLCNRISTPFTISDSPCRPVLSKCDLPEYCTTERACPPDVYLADRTPCDFNDGICFRGQCYLKHLPCGAFLPNSFSSDPMSRTNNSGNLPKVCTRHEICVDGRCLSINSIRTGTCPSSEDGQRCSGHGRCTNENTCICTCGWHGETCEMRSASTNNETQHHFSRESRGCLPPDDHRDVLPTTETASTIYPVAGGTEEKDEGEISATTFLANAIIGGSIALMFGVAVIFGATSIGFRKAKKKDRLRTMHQYRIMSIFQPTKAQQRKLNKQGGPRYTKGYRDRRKEHSKEKDQRIILGPQENHSSHTKHKQPRNHHHSHHPHRHNPNNIPTTSSSKILSETFV